MMTVVLELSDDLGALVETEAKRRAIDAGELVRELVASALERGESHRTAEQLRVLDSLLEIGDDDEQRETFEYLRTAVDNDRLSERRRFA